MEDALLRQSDYYILEARKLLDEGADYAKISHKLSMANECRRTAGEELESDLVLQAMHFFLLAQD